MNIESNGKPGRHGAWTYGRLRRLDLFSSGMTEEDLTESKLFLFLSSFLDFVEGLHTSSLIFSWVGERNYAIPFDSMCRWTWIERFCRIVV